MYFSIYNVLYLWWNKCCLGEHNILLIKTFFFLIKPQKPKLLNSSAGSYIFIVIFVIFEPKSPRYPFTLFIQQRNVFNISPLLLQRRHKKICICNCTIVIIEQGIGGGSCSVNTTEHEPSVSVHAFPTFLFHWQIKSLHSQIYFIWKTERKKLFRVNKIQTSNYQALNKTLH